MLLEAEVIAFILSDEVYYFCRGVGNRKKKGEMLVA